MPKTPLVTIYSTPTCHYCNEAKAFLKARGTSFTEYNVASDVEKRNEMVAISGGRMVPVITVGTQPYVGFDVLREAIDKGEIDI